MLVLFILVLLIKKINSGQENNTKAHSNDERRVLQIFTKPKEGSFLENNHQIQRINKQINQSAPHLSMNYGSEFPLQNDFNILLDNHKAEISGQIKGFKKSVQTNNENEAVINKGKMPHAKLSQECKTYGIRNFSTVSKTRSGANKLKFEQVNNITHLKRTSLTKNSKVSSVNKRNISPGFIEDLFMNSNEQANKGHDKDLSAYRSVNEFAHSIGTNSPFIQTNYKPRSTFRSNNYIQDEDVFPIINTNKIEKFATNIGSEINNIKELGTLNSNSTLLTDNTVSQPSALTTSTESLQWLTTGSNKSNVTVKTGEWTVFVKKGTAPDKCVSLFKNVTSKKLLLGAYDEHYEEKSSIHKAAVPNKFNMLKKKTKFSSGNERNKNSKSEIITLSHKGTTTSTRMPILKKMFGKSLKSTTKITPSATGKKIYPVRHKGGDPGNHYFHRGKMLPNVFEHELLTKKLASTTPNSITVVYTKAMNMTRHTFIPFIPKKKAIQKLKASVKDITTITSITSCCACDINDIRDILPQGPHLNQSDTS